MSDESKPPEIPEQIWEELERLKMFLASFTETEERHDRA